MSNEPQRPGVGKNHWGEEQLRLEILEESAERVVGRLEAGPRHHQPYGILHGGVYCSIVEDVASRGAGQSVLERGGVGVVGVANSTDFLRSHGEGELRAVAEPIHQSRTQQIWQVVISRTSDGKAVARGQVRFQILDRLPFEHGSGPA
jgi:1,4-dihydroxy-2-naphthoyl-CoA hydrolase